MVRRVALIFLLPVFTLAVVVYAQRTIESNDQLLGDSAKCHTFVPASGSPEASVSGKKCDEYIRTDGPPNRYYKATGTSGTPTNTGWQAVATSGAATPTVSNTSANSCGTTAATIAGNDGTGVITVGATSGSDCTVLFSVAAPTRRQCWTNNETTANLARYVYTDTTHGKFQGTFVAGDKISYGCSVY